MAKSKKIEKIATEDCLQFIRECVTSNLSEERITACVDAIRKPKDLDILLRLFSEMNNRFVEESDTLQEQSQEYNEKYATNINGRFSIAYNVLNIIRQQVFFLYRLLNATRGRHTHHNGYSSTMIDNSSIEYKINTSYIGNRPYTPNLFSLPLASQRRLVDEIINFLNCLDANLKLCDKVIKEEKYIGDNTDELNLRFNRQIKEIYDYVKGQKIKDCNEKFYYDLLTVEECPQNLKVWWHKINQKELSKVALGLYDTKLRPYTKMERKVFNEDPEKLKKFRIVVSNLDKVEDKITGEILVYVQRYTKCTSTQSSFHKCFQETYANLGGKHDVITYTRFNQAYTNAHRTDFQGYLDFVRKMDAFINMASENNNISA